MQRISDQLRPAGILAAAQLRTAANRRRVWVAGVVTHRQRPATASGVTFMNLQDETGMINVIVSVDTWQANATVTVGCSAAGRSPVSAAEHFESLSLEPTTASRDFR